MPTRRFLTRSPGNPRTFTGEPLRDFPEVADQADVVARIAEARDIRDEPEAVSRAIVNAHAELARTYDRLRHEADVEQRELIRRELTLEARMSEAHRRARLQRIDVSRELHVIGQMLAAAAGSTRQPRR